MQLPLQVERSIFTLIQPPLSEKKGTSPEPPKIFIREGSHGLIFDMYVSWALLDVLDPICAILDLIYLILSIKCALRITTVKNLLTIKNEEYNN